METTIGSVDNRFVERTVKGSVLSGIIWLSLAVCFTAVGIYLYIHSVSVSEDKDMVAGVLRSSLNDVKKFLVDSIDALICHVKVKNNEQIIHVGPTMMNFSSILIKLENLVDNRNIAKILDLKNSTLKIIDQLDAVLNSSITTVANNLLLENGNTRKVLNAWQPVDQNTLMIGDSLYDLLRSVEKFKKNHDDFWTKYSDLLNDSLTAIMEQSEKFQTIAEDMRRANDFVDSVKSFLIVLMIPALVQGFLTLTSLLVLVLRCFFQSSRNTMVMIGMAILNMSAYVSVAITALLFLTFAFCFVLAYSSSFLCMGLTTYGNIGQLKQTNISVKNANYMLTSNTTLRLDLIDILKKCHAGSSLFEAIYNPKDWDAEGLITSLLGEVTRILSNLQTSDSDLIRELMSSIVRYRMAIESFMDEMTWNSGTLSPTGEQSKKLATLALDGLLNFTEVATESMDVVCFAIGSPLIVGFLSPAL